jgi:dihydropteroate synthase
VERAAQYGRFIVNDVTTFINPKMIEVTARHELFAIASHLPLAADGDIQFAHNYLRMNDIGQVKQELEIQRDNMIRGGIDIKHIILDPGIGFGKSMALNWQLLKFAAQIPDLVNPQPLMIGPSHKRFLATDSETGLPREGIDTNDPVINFLAAKIAKDATDLKRRLLLRVHDVAAHRKLIAA